MGEVFLAWDDRLGRRVALKRLRQKDGLTASMLLHEARTAAQLNNVNIATVHDVVDADGRLHIVMEHLDGETLARRLRRGPLARHEIVAVALQMANALAAAHDHGVLHCDVKPGNVFLLPDGTVKVLDFGLARYFHASQADDAEGGISASFRAAGTLAYMAPEQILGAPLDPRTDIYSLGVVMREMLTGHANAADDAAPAAPVGSLTLDDVIARATAWDPAARWQSATAVVDALRQPNIAESRRESVVSYTRTRDGVRIACARSGSGSGSPLIYVRGWISHVNHMLLDENFRTLFDGLSAHREVVRFDCRGNGLSDRVQRGIELDDLVLDLESVFDGCGLQRAAIFATCFGGPIAIEFAARHPGRVRALIVDGSFARGRKLASPAKRLLLRKGLQTIPEAAFLILSYLTSPTTVGRSYRNPQVAKEMISPATAAALYDLAFRIDVTESASRLAVPTLILHRTMSSAVPIECGRDLARLIPGAQFLELPGSGHNPWDEDPQSVLRIITDFLAESAND